MLIFIFCTRKQEEWQARIFYINYSGSWYRCDLEEVTLDNLKKERRRQITLEEDFELLYIEEEDNHHDQVNN